MSGNASHRRKASIQQSRHASNSLGGSAALLSSGIHPTMGDRRLGPGGATTNTTTNSSDSTTSTGIWGGAASGDDAPLLPGGSISRKPINRSPLSTLQTRLVPSLPIARAQQLRRSTLYVASVALSMFLMLVFMTYNAWLIGAVLLGAACGHYLFSRDMGLGRLGEEKGMACH